MHVLRAGTRIVPITVLDFYPVLIPLIRRKTCYALGSGTERAVIQRPKLV